MTFSVDMTLHKVDFNITQIKKEHAQSNTYADMSK